MNYIFITNILIFALQKYICVFRTFSFSVEVPAPFSPEKRDSSVYHIFLEQNKTNKKMNHALAMLITIRYGAR